MLRFPPHGINIKKNIIGLMAYGLLLAGISFVYLFFAGDIALFVSFAYRLIPTGTAVLILAVIGGLLWREWFLWGWFQHILGIFCCLVLTFFVVIGILTGLSRLIKAPGDFSVTTPFFAEKNVMVFIPHQDDEINLMGGILEQYTAAGSRVSVVFSTNGDFLTAAETRMEEALDALAEAGIPKEDVYFLGFGDSWQSQQQNDCTVHHIYNCQQPGQIWTSATGNTQSYGTVIHDSYLTGAYTRENYLLGIQALILEQMPDVIYCVDYDSHIDHKALDLFFEEAMGNILAEYPDYAPDVYKGFCYGTAWYAEDDFSESFQLQSTKEPDPDVWAVSGLAYNWEERLRIPLGTENLNRILTNNTVYRSLSRHASQNAYYHSANILNTDKVFWQRRTDNLLYHAVFLGDGQPVELWNDFKLRDSLDISQNYFPADGAHWAEVIDVRLPQAEYIQSLVLYDHPDVQSNILAGYVELPDGTQVPFGSLSSAGTRVSVPGQALEAFRICLTDAEGPTPGLTEIEAYGEPLPQETQWILAVDSCDNLATDYWIEDGNYAELHLCSFPGSRPISPADVEITLEGGASCYWEIDEDILRVFCPRGEKAVVTLTESNAVSTCFRVSNPGPFVRNGIRMLQWADRHTAYAWEAIAYLWDMALSRLT